MDRCFAILFLCFFSAFALAQRQDPLGVYFTYYDPHHEKQLDINLGIFPPVKFDRYMWINSLGYRHVQGELLNHNHEIDLNEYRYSSFLRGDINTDWSWSYGFSASVKNVGSLIWASRASTFYSNFLFFNHTFGLNRKYKALYGVVVPDRSQSVRIIPAAGIEFDNEQGDLNFQIAFPNTGLRYNYSDDTKIGLQLQYDNSSYFVVDARRNVLDEDHYLKVEKLSIGSFLRTRLYKYLYLNGRLSYALFARTGEEDDSYNVIRTYKDTEGWLMSLGISVGFDQPKPAP